MNSTLLWKLCYLIHEGNVITYAKAPIMSSIVRGDYYITWKCGMDGRVHRVEIDSARTHDIRNYINICVYGVCTSS
jgi:hypothetical protein